jgi:acetylornithine deacetylase/succinyl-diaminopimelate desuccinylase-like protein
VENRSTIFLFLGFLLVLTAGAILLDLPPSRTPSSVPEQEFSAGRAVVYISDFAQKPHPIGTPEHDRVRDNLLAQIASLFITPEVQRATGVTELYQAAGRIENILVRLRGVSGSSDAVMLAAHYDSVSAGPGAADDGCGVATLLETLRNLSASAPLRNDVILLFPDSEEDGMLGASAFAKEHPWAKDVRVVINFEARGTSGDSQLFETSSGNGQLIQILAQAVSHPVRGSHGLRR